MLVQTMEKEWKQGKYILGRSTSKELLLLNRMKSEPNINCGTDERDLECQSSYTIGYKYTI